MPTWQSTTTIRSAFSQWFKRPSSTGKFTLTATRTSPAVRPWPKKSRRSWIRNARPGVVAPGAGAEVAAADRAARYRIGRNSRHEKNTEIIVVLDDCYRRGGGILTCARGSGATVLRDYRREGVSHLRPADRGSNRRHPRRENHCGRQGCRNPFRREGD